jgi:hypothetical protein
MQTSNKKGAVMPLEVTESDEEIALEEALGEAEEGIDGLATDLGGEQAAEFYEHLAYHCETMARVMRGEV